MSLERVARIGDAPVVEDAGRRYRAVTVEATPVALQVPAVLEPPTPAPPRPYRPPADEGGPLRRFSPRRGWSGVRAFDEKLERLDQQRVRLGERLASLEQAIREAELADKKAIAAWQVAGETGTRPVPTVPALEAELAEVRAEIDSMAIAEDSILKEKVEYVAKHRKNLVADAAKGRTAAVARLKRQSRIRKTLAPKLWKHSEPRPGRSTSHARRQTLIRSVCSSSAEGARARRCRSSGRSRQPQVFAYLLDDAAWLDAILAETDGDRPLDPHERAIWEQTPEGHKAIALANERVAMGLRPRAVHAAEWEEG